MDIFGLSEQNRQSEPPPRKPNEDSFGYFIEGGIAAGVVMDGIPVLRNKDGAYPEDNGMVASRIALGAALGAIHREPDANGRQIFGCANRAIRRRNKLRGCYKKPPSMWLATVGVTAWVQGGKVRGASIGDPVALYIPPQGKETSLCEDQLAEVRKHIRQAHAKEDAYGARLRDWHDRHVRNKPGPRTCVCGAPVAPWGGLTGEEEALSFVREFELQGEKGGILVLASDAIRPFLELGDLSLLHELGETPEKACRKLLELTREAEQTQGARSDDATFVVVYL